MRPLTDRQFANFAAAFEALKTVIDRVAEQGESSLSEQQNTDIDGLMISLSDYPIDSVLMIIHQYCVWYGKLAYQKFLLDDFLDEFADRMFEWDLMEAERALYRITTTYQYH